MMVTFQTMIDMIWYITYYNYSTDHVVYINRLI